MPNWLLFIFILFAITIVLCVGIGLLVNKARDTDKEDT
jgi:hypothetical protein